MLTSWILTAALSAAPLIYSAPVKGNPEPKQYEVSEFEKGAEVQVATDEANVRKEPKVGGAVVATLPIGTALVVDEKVGGPVRVQDRVGHWYRVHLAHPKEDGVSGFAFGPGLTPYGFTADVDGDGTPDVVTCAFTGDFQLRVRCRGKGGVQSIDVKPTGMAYLSRKGGMVSASLIPAKEAGVALLKLEFRIEACGDYKDSYVSFEGGVPRLALEASGLSDPPTIADFKIAFDAAKKTAVVHNRVAEVDDKGTEKDKEKTADRYELVGGVYKKVGTSKE